MHVVVLLTTTIMISHRKSTINLWYTITPNQFHILENTDIPPPCQSSIDALNTTTPNLPDIYRENNVYIPMAD